MYILVSNVDGRSTPLRGIELAIFRCRDFPLALRCRLVVVLSSIRRLSDVNEIFLSVCRVHPDACRRGGLCAEDAPDELVEYAESDGAGMKRIASLDFLKAFAIATVLLGHSVEQLSGDAFWDHPIWAFLYTFHMPLFMFLSGFFFKSSLRKDFRAVLGAKLVQLGAPSVAAFLVGLAIMKCAGVSSIADLCEASFAGFMNSVWFLKCLLFCIVIMWPAVKICRHDVLAAVVASVAVLLVPGGDVVNLNFMLPCFCLGFVCGSHEETLARHRRSLACLAGAVFLALLPFWSGRLTVYMVPTRVLSFSPFSFDVPAGDHRPFPRRLPAGLAVKPGRAARGDGGALRLPWRRSSLSAQSAHAAPFPRRVIGQYAGHEG